MSRIAKLDAAPPQPPMGIIEAYDALMELKGEIGPSADISIYLSTSDLRKTPLSATIYAGGLMQRTPNFRCEGSDLRQVIADLRAGWAGFQDEHARRMTADMALEIIRITDAHGTCTDAALRGDKFSVGDVARWGAAACAKANEMAGRGPFEIVPIGGANGAAA